MSNKTARFRIICAFLLMTGILVFTPTVGAQQNLDLKPNLQPLPASDLALLPNDSSGTKLVFSTTTWNSGKGPLEMIAEPADPGTGTQKVYQRVYTENGAYYDSLAGTFEWHEAHNHFHLEDYALYTLQPVTAPGASQRTGSKTTFCLIDNFKVDTRLPGAAKRPVYVTCGPNIQGISVGWGDIYRSSLEGQSVDFTGNPDGIYKLSIEADPMNRLLETNEGDNVSCLLIQVTGFTVTALGGCTSGAVVVSSITPAFGQLGTVVPVTIKGSGFTAGIPVSFEGGSGPAPTLSNVVLVDAETITADVTVRTGGSDKDRVWDLRVGSGSLANAFTLIP